jgi:rSAM/selenodomain-associated transferase 2
MKISVIVPVLNERNYLPTMLAALTNLDLHEVIVVDGGSTDGSREYLRQEKNAKVIYAPQGRGNQMNSGARMATGDVLLFLHCDCCLPQDTPQQIAKALTDGRVVGGCFLVRFLEDSRSLRLISWGINRRTLFTHTATGDQAIFVRRSVYEAIDGFAPWPLFEDVDLVSRIKRKGTFVVVSRHVVISARRWLTNGVWRTTLMMYALRVGYYAGISPFTLKLWFQDVRVPESTDYPKASVVDYQSLSRS